MSRGKLTRPNHDLFPHGATAKPISQWPFFVRSCFPIHASPFMLPHSCFPIHASPFMLSHSCFPIHAFLFRATNSGPSSVPWAIHDGLGKPAHERSSPAKTWRLAQKVPFLSSRPGARNPIGRCVSPPIARSASASPITGANLKPCPLKPAAIATFEWSG